MGGNFQYSYLANSGLLENLTRPNGVSTQWNYEAHRDLITQVANGSVSTFDYVNDALGRRTSMSRSGSAFTVPDILTYGYNDRSEVISAQANTNSAYNYHYNYDPIGNRTTATLAGVNWSYISNNLNQYTQLTFGDTVQEPTYDADGNMLTRSGWTQSWNGENRLIEIVKGDIKLQFSYDYMGRRVEKKVYNGETLTKHLRFVYNGYKLSEELDAQNDNATLRKYTWQAGIELDMPLSVYDTVTTETYFYITNANKNVSELIDSKGNIVVHYEYTPFGQQLISDEMKNNINPLRFSSEYYDTETELIYYNYRYYDFQTGKWLSKDPSEELGGINLYNMLNNDPLNKNDYLGLGIWAYAITGEWNPAPSVYDSAMNGFEQGLTWGLNAYMYTGEWDPSDEAWDAAKNGGQQGTDYFSDCFSDCMKNLAISGMNAISDVARSSLANVGEMGAWFAEYVNNFAKTNLNASHYKGASPFTSYPRYFTYLLATMKLNDIKLSQITKDAFNSATKDARLTKNLIHGAKGTIPVAITAASVYCSITCACQN